MRQISMHVDPGGKNIYTMAFIIICDQHRHGDGHYPKLNDHNDYKLISGEESNGRTILKFSRMIDTCDKQDRKLEVKLVVMTSSYIMQMKCC